MTAPNSEGDVVLVPHALVKFLLGEGEYQGRWFEDGGSIRFWWRTPLRAALQPSPDGVREKVAGIIQPLIDAVAANATFTDKERRDYAARKVNEVLAALPPVSGGGLGPVIAAARSVVLAAWTDRFVRLHDSEDVHALDRAFKAYDYARQQAAPGREGGQ